MQDSYPKAVAIKKGWMTVGLVVIGVLVSLLVSLLFFKSNAATNSNQNQNNKDAVGTLANLSDVNTLATAAQDATPVVKINPPMNHTVTNTSASQPPPLSAWQKMRLKAMQASITSNQINLPSQDNNDASNQSNNFANSESTTPNIYSGHQQQNHDFLNAAQNSDSDYLSSSVEKPISPYELQAGTMIPAILISGIDSDLPGQILATVRSNVYDSISGGQLLIPMGSKLIGTYDSQVSYGQTRALVAWQRILFPNGASIDLQGIPGVDLMGYAGLADKVNNHYGTIFSSVLLMSVLGAGAQLSQPPENNSLYQNPTVGQTLAQNVGTNIANTGDAIINKALDIQPTIMIRPGYLFNISVTKDMVFPGAYRD